MTIANTALTDTFDLWRTRFNQVAVIVNSLTEGAGYSTGTLTLANPTYSNGNTSLNVSNGFIRVQGNTFSSNTLTLTSNSSVLVISGTGRLGSTVYFDMGALSVRTDDTSTANIASANTVNTTHRIATYANTWALSGYALANAAITQANTAYNRANTYWAFSSDNANAAFVQANTAYTKANNSTLAWDQANTALTVAQNAFGKANTANANTTLTGTTTITGTVVNQASVQTQTLSDSSGTINWDMNSGIIASVTLSGTGRTMAAPTNIKVGTYILHVIQDGTGNRTITSWNACFKWPGGVAPVLSTTGTRRDIISFISDGSSLFGSFAPDMR